MNFEGNIQLICTKMEKQQDHNHSVCPHMMVIGGMSHNCGARCRCTPMSALIA